MKDIKATIFIPTYNGQAYISDILKAIFSQRVDFSYEVLIIDSGSKDNTIPIINKFIKKHAKQMKLIEIENKEFGHGKTRDYAASIARGEIMVYLSHDAIPSHNRWLYEMVAPFELSPEVMGVVGKQIPRPRCVPLLKYEIRSVFENMGPDFGTTFFYKDSFIKSQGQYDAVCFYSDVNSATRRDLITKEIPYKDVPYAEDYIFGRDIIEAGYKKVYTARGSVIHSNDLTLREYKHRIFDETVGIRRLGIKVRKPSYKSMLKLFVLGSLRDAARTLRDNEYSTRRKLYWLIVNPFYHIEKLRGLRIASMVNIKDDDIFSKYSLERIRDK